MRDFSKILALVKAVAVIRHARREVDTQGRVVATSEDYETVRGLVGGMYEAAVTGATDGVRQVVAAVQAGAKTVAAVNEGVEKMTGSRPAKQSVTRWIGMALAGEWIRNDEANPKRPKDLRPGDIMPDRVGLVQSRSHEYTVSMSLGGEEQPIKSGGYEDHMASYGKLVVPGQTPETVKGNRELGGLARVPSEKLSHGTAGQPGQPSTPVSAGWCPTCHRFRCVCPA